MRPDVVYQAAEGFEAELFAELRRRLGRSLSGDGRTTVIRQRSRVSQVYARAHHSFQRAVTNDVENDLGDIHVLY